ncbi:MAG TPA: BolA family protein [Stellaceae bacterium]|nr:BolA family protein [Stellaceae bacterium]
MSMAATITAKLTEALAPTRLALVDDSARHAGHAGAAHSGGAREGGETHFNLEIVSAKFAGKSRVERQRLVYGLLSAELAGQVHALALRTLTPEEDA